ncbi:MAG: YitT family protein [Dethiobacteria bacterium]
MKKRGRQWKKILWETAGLIAGTAIMAVGLNLLLVPNRLAAGGASGLAIILFHLWNIPVGLTIFLANVPLFILSYLLLGRKVIQNSFLGMIFLSLFSELFRFLPTFTSDLLLASIFGGVILGFGMWIVFEFGGSTGGTALASLLLNRIKGITLGQGLLGTDLLIIMLAALVFGIEIAMYATISLFVSSWFVDLLQDGFSLVKVVLVITEEKETITRKIFQDLNRGVTFFKGEGGFTGEKREMLFCVVTRPQVARLKHIVYETDPAAFVIIGNAGETIGEGFKEQEYLKQETGKVL